MIDPRYWPPNDSDFKTLELELYKSFEYELKKELKEPNSYFR